MINKDNYLPGWVEQLYGNDHPYGPLGLSFYDDGRRGYDEEERVNKRFQISDADVVSEDTAGRMRYLNRDNTDEKDLEHLPNEKLIGNTSDAAFRLRANRARAAFKLSEMTDGRVNLSPYEQVRHGELVSAKNGFTSHGDGILLGLTPGMNPDTTIAPAQTHEPARRATRVQQP